MISSFVYFRIDLTQEKRYTLSEPTKQILQKLPGKILIKVYLNGELPGGFTRLSRTVKETLDEFRVVAGDNIQYSFIDPYAENDEKKIQSQIQELYKQGLEPVSVKIKDKKGDMAEKNIIPGAIASYNGIDFPINLLNNNPGLSAEENLTHSEQSLEYSLINAIHCLANRDNRKIAFIEGHGEYDQYQVADITRELASYFQVDRGEIHGNQALLLPYSCIIIANPTKPWAEEDKFAVDQYIMQGGKVLWLIDPVSVARDSLVYGKTFANIAQLNLDDQLFRYGMRLNPVLVQDIQCNIIPVNTATSNTQPKFSPAPWLYLPLLAGNPTSPVSRNINMIKSEYTSYIDTLDIKNIHFTSLLTTSSKARIKTVPYMISMQEIKQQPVMESFDKQFLPVAVLAEGTFTSVFKNRMLDDLKITGSKKVIDSSVYNKMIVIADADIIRNDVKYANSQVYLGRIGRDKYTSQVFGNKDFILNAIQYLTDDNGLISIRNKEVKMRLLNKNKLTEELRFWQTLNMILPLIIVAISALIFFYIQKKRFI